MKSRGFKRVFVVLENAMRPFSLLSPSGRGKCGAFDEGYLPSVRKRPVSLSQLPLFTMTVDSFLQS